MIVNNLLTNVRFITLCHDHLSEAQRKEMRIVVGHVMHLETMDVEFTSLVEYIKYKLLERDNQKLEAQWPKEHVKKMVDYVVKQMQDFDILQKLRKRNGVGTHFTICSIQFMHSNVLLPLFHGHITKKKPQACTMMFYAT